MSEEINTTKESLMDGLFKAGAHFGFVKSRRHPSAKPYIFGSKNNIEVFDLEKTQEELKIALAFIEKKGEEGINILFVGGKSEAREAVEKAGLALDMFYVAGRWIGGTLTNFSEIKKRLARLEELTEQKDKGELGKYTKKERLLLDREIAKLTIYFGGISSMKALPKVMFIIDPRKESIAVAEARKMNIPVVALAGTDSNLHEVEYPIPGNDSSRQSINYITNLVVEAYKKGKANAPKPARPHDSSGAGGKEEPVK